MMYISGPYRIGCLQRDKVFEMKSRVGMWTRAKSISLKYFMQRLLKVKEGGGL